MQLGNPQFIRSFSGIFRLLTVIFGVPAVALSWIAYFNSSWTKAFPEILAILEADRTGTGTRNNDPTTTSTIPTTSTLEPESSEEDYDLITDEEEKYLDDILFQTLMYEKIFIGIVTAVLIFSVAYLIIRIVQKPMSEDSPYEIIFDFIFHVLSALGLLTGAALVLLSAAKIQNFIDKIDDDLPPAVIEIINKEKDVQDKADKIAAGAIGMFNGILYALCVVTLRMTHPLDCRRKRKVTEMDFPRFSVASLGVLDSRKNSVISYGTPAFYME